MSEVKARPTRSRAKPATTVRVIDLPGAAEAMAALDAAVAALVDDRNGDIESWQCDQFIIIMKEYAWPKLMTAMMGTGTAAAVSASLDLEALLLSCAADPDPDHVTPAGRAMADAAVDALYALFGCLDYDIKPGDRSPLCTWATEPGHAPHVVVAEPAAIPDERCEHTRTPSLGGQVLHAQAAIPDGECEYRMQNVEAAVRVLLAEVDDRIFPAVYALGLAHDSLLPSLRAQLAVIDFTDADRLGSSQAKDEATHDLFTVQSLLILAANVKDSRPDLARIALDHLQFLANYAVPGNAGGEPPDPSDWVAAPAQTEPSAGPAAPSANDVAHELERARVLLGILIQRAMDGVLAAQEATITLADEALRRVVNAARLVRAP